MVRSIHTLSDWIARCERGVARVLVLALPLMILANVTGRAFRSPIYWIDELAVLTMVWLAMIGMALTLKTRDAVAVTLLLDMVPATVGKILQMLVDILVLAFALALLLLCYMWFDPLLLITVDFDTSEFSAQSFNFIYDEPTTTLGIRKFWFWLIVPVVAFTSAVHALSNLLRTLTAPSAAVVREAATVASGE